MKIGFTGSRAGLSEKQKYLLSKILDSFGCLEFHHGDCIGADEQAHKLAVSMEIKTVKHPPINSFLQANCEADEVREAKPYLDRNKDIVNETELLVACPKEDKEVLRSGTWATIRYAKKLAKSIWVLYPCGCTESFNLTPFL